MIFTVTVVVFKDSYHYGNTGIRVVGLLSSPTSTDMIHGCADRQYTLQWGKDAYEKLTAKPVSYTHLDVYKRQGLYNKYSSINRL